MCMCMQCKEFVCKEGIEPFLGLENEVLLCQCIMLLFQTDITRFHGSVWTGSYGAVRYFRLKVV